MAAVTFHSSSLVNLGTPGLVGLALSYAAPVVSLLNGFLTTFTETEKEMISVERVAEVKSIIFVLMLIHHASLDITI